MGLADMASSDKSQREPIAGCLLGQYSVLLV